MGPDARNPRPPAAAYADPGAAALALRGPLPDRAEAQHVVGEAGRDRHARVDHRAELSGPLDAAAVPVELEAQRVVHFGDARAGEAGRAAHRTGIGGEPVDVARREAGVRDRGEAGVERELERIAPEAAPDLGLPDPGDRGAPFEDLHHASPGSNSGSQTSSRCSNTTRTRIPIRTLSAGQFTMLVIRRSPRCSSSSTIAIA